MQQRAQGKTRERAKTAIGIREDAANTHLGFALHRRRAREDIVHLNVRHREPSASEGADECRLGRRRAKFSSFYVPGEKAHAAKKKSRPDLFCERRGPEKTVRHDGSWADSHSASARPHETACTDLLQTLVLFFPARSLRAPCSPSPAPPPSPPASPPANPWCRDLASPSPRPSVAFPAAAPSPRAPPPRSGNPCPAT